MRQETGSGNRAIMRAHLRQGLPACLILATFPLVVIAGQVAFDLATSPSVGSSPQAVAVGKLDANNNDDIVVSNTTGNTVSVLLGNGDGTFATQVPYNTGAYPYAVILDDFNNDGKLDIVAVNRGDFPVGSVSLLLGNGDGTFQTQHTAAVGYSPRSAASGDFGNGHIDLAVTNGPDATVSVLLNDGAGSFATQVPYATGGNHPEGIAAVRLATGGNLDLVVAAGNVVSVLRGNGNGTFQTAVTYPAVSGASLTALAVTDFNDDGAPDVVVANGIVNSISVFLGNGNGTLQPRVDYPSTAATYALAVGDFDRDGRKDVAAVSSSSPNLALVFLGNGDGTLQSAVIAATLPGTSGFVAVGNFRNSEADLAVADYSAKTQVLLNRGLIFASTFENPNDCPPGTIRLANGECGVP